MMHISLKHLHLQTSLNEVNQALFACCRSVWRLLRTATGWLRISTERCQWMQWSSAPCLPDLGCCYQAEAGSWVPVSLQEPEPSPLLPIQSTRIQPGTPSRPEDFCVKEYFFQKITNTLWHLDPFYKQAQSLTTFYIFRKKKVQDILEILWIYKELYLPDPLSPFPSLNGKCSFLGNF